MGVVEIDLKEKFGGPIIQRVVKVWRPDPKDISICRGFCKKHGTGECPAQGNLPAQGFCEHFAVNASTVTEVQELYTKDQARFNICLCPKTPI